MSALSAIIRNKFSSVLRGKRIVLARRSNTMDKFSWLGKGSSVGGASIARGTLRATYRRSPYVRGVFDNVSRIVSAPSAGSEFTLSVKEQTANSLYDWDGEWDIDIRTQSCGFRADPVNWDMIKRTCRCSLQGPTSDQETTYNQDEDGEVIISEQVVSPDFSVIINGVSPRTLELYSLYSEYANMTTVPRIATRRDCELVLSVGHDGSNDYGVGYGEDILDLAFGDLDISSDPIVDLDTVDRILLVVDSAGLVWRSLDEGENFVVLAGVTNVVIVKAYSYGEMYLGTSAGAVLKSTDGGATFSTITSYGSMTGDVVAITKSYDEIVSFLDENALLAVLDEDVIQRIDDISATIDDPTDMLWADGNLYVAGYDSNAPIIIGSNDGGISWETLLEITGSDDLDATFDFTPVLRLSSCGCGVVYATAMYSVGAGGAKEIHSAVYRNVDFGLFGFWVTEWSESQLLSAAGELFMPFDVVCCGPNYAVVAGVFWDRTPEGYAAGALVLN